MGKDGYQKWIKNAESMALNRYIFIKNRYK